MKKIISIISTTITILAGIVFLNSCRQENEDPMYENELRSTNSIMKESGKNSDSLQELSNLNEFDGEIDYNDPPPKNGGQWKIKK